jgi:hypothetical protein
MAELSKWEKLVDRLDIVRVWIGEYFQVRAYWYYIFNRSKLVRDRAWLDERAERVRREKQGPSLRHRLWRHAFGLLCKVNGYTPRS